VAVYAKRAVQPIAIGSVCDFRSTIYLESSQLSATEPVHMRPFEAT